MFYPISALCSPLFTRIPVVALPTVFAADSFAKKYHLPLQLLEAWGCRLYKYFMPYIQADVNKMKRYNPNIISRIIPQGVGVEYFKIVQKKPKFILYLGRLDTAQKGIDLLLRAYALVADQIKYPLVIAGHGTDEQSIKNMIRELHLEQKVLLAGPAYGKKKMSLLSEALCVAMPSRYDNLPLFSLEALASGLPLVTFNIADFAWLKPSFSLMAKAFDVNEYADKLLKLSHTKDIISMKHNARDHVRKMTWNNVAEQMSNFFEFIVRKEGII
jgi:glycosyltransferase involved in cell wall biosynthesis